MRDLPRRLRTAGLLLALAVVVGSLGMVTAAQQRASEEDFVERLELRPHLAARFVGAYMIPSAARVPGQRDRRAVTPAVASSPPIGPARWWRRHDPAMMVALLLYGYAIGERSSRRRERRCVEDVATRVESARRRHDAADVLIKGRPGLTCAIVGTP